MKRYLSAALIAFFISATFGCQKPQEPDAVPKAAAVSSTPNPAEKPGNNWTHTIKLDNGKKWKANPETTAGIRKMTDLLDTTPDPKTLHGELSSALNELVQKCSMSGPAHDNLHVYLIPLMDKLDELARTESPETAARVIDDLKNHLAAYKEYFE